MDPEKQSQPTGVQMESANFEPPQGGGYEPEKSGNMWKVLIIILVILILGLAIVFTISFLGRPVDDTNSQVETTDELALLNEDTIPPTVSILSPENGDLVSGLVMVEVSATDESGIRFVDFAVDGRFKKSDKEAPYEFEWQSAEVENGVHTISVSVTDQNGVSADSEISVDVDNVVGKFRIGERVEVITKIPGNNLKIRDAAGGELLGKQKDGNRGEIVGGPEDSGNYTWWEVDFDDRADGWGAEDFLGEPTDRVIPSTGGSNPPPPSSSNRTSPPPVAQSCVDFQACNPTTGTILTFDSCGAEPPSIWSRDLSVCLSTPPPPPPQQPPPPAVNPPPPPPQPSPSAEPPPPPPAADPPPPPPPADPPPPAPENPPPPAPPAEPPPPPPPLFTGVNGSVIDASSDKAGVWGQFGPGFSPTTEQDRDWHIQAEIALNEEKTVDRIDIEIIATGQIWSTTDVNKYPLVPFKDGVQLIDHYVLWYEEEKLGTYPAGTHTFDLYAQIEDESFTLGKITVDFTDGTTVTGTIPASSVTP